MLTSYSQAPDLVFQPSLEQESPDSFHSLVEGLLNDVYNFATLVPRVAKHKDSTDYHADIEEVRPCHWSLYYSYLAQQGSNRLTVFFISIYWSKNLLV